MGNNWAGEAIREHSGEGTGIDPVLRAKYLDYCSARISEVFLSLSDERIYALGEEAALDSDLDVGSLSFRAMVRIVTTRLRDSMSLPDLATWAREYREDPRRYDDHLLGLWEGERESGSPPLSDESAP